MYRVGLFSALIILLAASCEGSDRHVVYARWPIPEARDTIWIESLVIDNAEFLYEHFNVEYLLCLEGNQIRPHVIEVLDFRLAHVVYTDSHHLTFDIPCHKLYPETIGTLHNHRNGAPGRLCHLSHNDIQAFLESPDPIMVVQCGPRKWAFFTRAYVEQYPDTRYLPAIPSYVTDFPEDSIGEETGRVEG